MYNSGGHRKSIGKMVLPWNGILSRHTSHKCKTDLFSLFWETLCIANEEGQARHGKEPYLPTACQLFAAISQNPFFSFPFTDSASQWLLDSRASISPFIFASNRKEHCKTSLRSNLPSARGRVLTNSTSPLAEAGQGMCLRGKGALE